MKHFSPRRIFITGLLFILASLLLLGFGAGESETPWPIAARDTAEEISLSQAWQLLNAPVEGRQAAVVGMEVIIETPLRDVGGAAPDDAAGMSPDGRFSHQVAQLPYPATDLIASMAREAAVDVRIFETLSFKPTWVDRVLSIAPILIILALVAIFMSRGATKSMGLSSAFEIIETDKLKDGFSDVAGIDAASSEIEEIVQFLKDPGEASRLGGRMPKGVLLDGPPGAGKTLIARAMAKEAGVPFITIEASGINQIFVGAGALKIKRAFKEARKHAPCIVFIDEIDALGKTRGSSGSGAGDEKDASLNALLTELDGFDPSTGVFLIAATNRPEVLDPALTRRGRIDRRITVDLPDIAARKDILRVHLRRIKAAVGLDIDGIAGTTYGFSGADLAALVNEAALMASRAEPKREFVEIEDFQQARDRLLVGLSGRQRKLNEADRNITAVHEAGHALVAALNEHADPIEKATIIPQGRAAGYVMQAPTQDRTFETKASLLARIDVAVAGREAERLIFGEDGITSGAESDIQQATRIAEAMVSRLGMSSQGFVRIDPTAPMLHNPSAPPILEITRLISDCQKRVAALLTEEKDRLIAIAEALKSQETLDGAAIAALARS